MSDNETNDEDTQTGVQNKNALEWSVTAVGAAIVLFVVGFMVYEIVSGASGPAQLNVTLSDPTIENGTAMIPVEVENSGEEVAEAAVIEVCAGPESCGQITFSYVPFQSKTTGVVGLDAPLSAPLTSRVVSYRNP